MRDRTHLPRNFDTDLYAAKVLKEEVTHELAQARGKLKKTVRLYNTSFYRFTDVQNPDQGKPLRRQKCV